MSVYPPGFKPSMRLIVEDEVHGTLRYFFEGMLAVLSGHDTTHGFAAAVEFHNTAVNKQCGWWRVP